MSIYAKDNGTWVPVGPAVNISAEGAPGAPTILNPEGGSVIKFTAAPQGAAGPNLAHGASISPEDGATVTVDQDNLEVAVLGATPFTDYVVSVYGVNEAGRGDIAKTDAFQLNYNDATGGDVPEGTEYTRLSDNTRWRYHKFTSASGTFTVTDNPQKFRVLLVGGGGGTISAINQAQGGGGAGGMIEDEINLDIKGHSVAVGRGGSQANGTDSTFGGLTAKGGGRGGKGNGQQNGSSGGSGGGGYRSGAGTAGQGNAGGGDTSPYTGAGGGGAGGAGVAGAGYSGGPGGAGGSGRVSDITNVNTYYGGGGRGATSGGGSQGGGGGYNQAGTNGLGGGAGARVDGSPTPAGGHGVVIVAYQIAATSTSRQIEQAQAEAAARQAGVEQGIEQGYSQAQEDLQEELTSLRTQIAGAAGTTETMLIDGKEQQVKRTRKGRRK